MNQALSSLLQIGLLSFGYLYATSNIALAQITSDGTVNTQVNQNGNVAEITGGETRGSNLFHSFQDFSVQTGNEAFFNNADSISNILSRVTGGNISNINGLIRANGSASLFLINPAGIIFGENASLDLGGSFYSSTASSILFEDGEFSAVDNLQQPLLTINAPIGLSFRSEPGEIVNLSRANDDRGLEVDPGEDLGLLGGNISFDGGIITASGGTVELGGLSAAGEISINEDSSLIFPEGVEQADVSLSNEALVQVLSGEGNAGNITINTNTLSMNGSQIQTDNQGTGNAGNISISANENIILQNNSNISAQAFGEGNGGNIDIDTRFLVFFPMENNNISASAEFGNEGEIAINIEAAFGISITSLLFSGQVQGGFLADLDSVSKIIPVDSQQTIAEACQANREVAAPSGLNIIGKGGIPPAPELPLDSHNIIVSDQANPQSTIPAPIETAQGKIQPARGVIVTESGEIILTAYRTNNAGDRIPEKRNCS